jgi:hypothetical protein
MLANGGHAISCSCVGPQTSRWGDIPLRGIRLCGAEGLFGAGCSITPAPWAPWGVSPKCLTNRVPTSLGILGTLGTLLGHLSDHGLRGPYGCALD